MHKIKREVEEIQKCVDRWFSGNSIADDENTIGRLENIAERLIYEIAYFKENRRLRNYVNKIKISAVEKARKVSKRTGDLQSTHTANQSLNNGTGYTCRLAHR